MFSFLNKKYKFILCILGKRFGFDARPQQTPSDCKTAAAFSWNALLLTKQGTTNDVSVDIHWTVKYVGSHPNGEYIHQNKHLMFVPAYDLDLYLLQKLAYANQHSSNHTYKLGGDYNNDEQEYIEGDELDVNGDNEYFEDDSDKFIGFTNEKRNDFFLSHQQHKKRSTGPEYGDGVTETQSANDIAGNQRSNNDIAGSSVSINDNGESTITPYLIDGKDVFNSAFGNQFADSAKGSILVKRRIAIENLFKESIAIDKNNGHSSEIEDEIQHWKIGQGWKATDDGEHSDEDSSSPKHITKPHDNKHQIPQHSISKDCDEGVTSDSYKTYCHSEHQKNDDDDDDDKKHDDKKQKSKSSDKKEQKCRHVSMHKPIITKSNLKIILLLVALLVIIVIIIILIVLLMKRKRHQRIGKAKKTDAPVCKDDNSKKQYQQTAQESWITSHSTIEISDDDEKPNDNNTETGGATTEASIIFDSE